MVIRYHLNTFCKLKIKNFFPTIEASVNSTFNFKLLAGYYDSYIDNVTYQTHKLDNLL